MSGALGFIGLLFFLVVWRGFKRYGGLKNYVPPV
jgi:hypothetical protein